MSEKEHYVASCSPITAMSDLVCTGTSSTLLHPYQHVLKPSHSTAMGMSADAPYSSTRNALNIVKSLFHVEPKGRSSVAAFTGMSPRPS